MPNADDAFGGRLTAGTFGGSGGGLWAAICAPAVVLRGNSPNAPLWARG